MAIAGLGGSAGFLAGLLGIGGGIILVPGLYMLFSHWGYAPDHLMHLAIGTSLAIIIPTGLSSAYAHWRRRAVEITALQKIAPGIAGGVLAGTIAINYIDGSGLQLFFAIMLTGLAVLMQIDTERHRLRESLPAQPGPATAGAVIGFVSTLMGIGGATMNVPYMALHGITVHRAIATAAAMGPIIALPATLGFMVSGREVEGLPPYSLGYVSLMAFAVITPVSVLAAPLGARTAHRFSKTLLRRIFSVFMLLVAIKMGYEALLAG